jgi:site-specific recombinase XerD
MTDPLSRIARRLVDASSFREELAQFATWLVAERYAPFVVEQHVRRMDFILMRLPRGRPPAVYSTEQLEAVFGAESKPRSRLFRFAGTRRVYQRFLLAYGRLRTPHSGDRFAQLRGQYAQYLIDIRGLSLSSRQHHAQTVADFLARALRPRQALRSMTRSDVERFVLLRSKEISRHSLQHTVAHIRAFLRYAHDNGHIRERLDALDTPRTYRGELPPRAVPWPMVVKLLASIDRRSKSGWRDLCILHLSSHYGLRPSEIVALCTDSIDWYAQILRVYQRKTRSELLLPLERRTLQLLRDYLHNDATRVTSAHPRLFHRARCPYIPLERTAISDILCKRAREAGLTLFGKSSYRLRHTFAMRLLTRGVGIKAIGDVLGHRSLESTCAYLRLDHAMLRDVALAVPGAHAVVGGRHV